VILDGVAHVDLSDGERHPELELEVVGQPMSGNGCPIVIVARIVDVRSHDPAEIERQIVEGLTI
jgi:hypothetical protein